MNTRELLEKRAALLTRSRELLRAAEARKQDLTANEESEFKRLLQEAELIRAEIYDQEARAAADAQSQGLRYQGFGSEPIRPEPEGPWAAQGRRAGVSVVGTTPDGREIRALSHGARLVDELHGSFRLPQGVEPKDLSAGRYLRGCMTGIWEGAEAERELRALSGSSDPGGGYLLPGVLSAQVIDLARAQSVLDMAGARVIPMDSASLTIAKLDADPTASWKREKPDVEATEETTTSFGALELRARTLICVVRSSLELVMDAPNFADAIERALAQVLGLRLDSAGLQGDGSDTYGWIVGVSNDPGINLVNAAGLLTNFDEFSSAVELIAMENGQASAAILNPREAGDLDRLADTTGQPMAPPESWKALRKFTSTQLPGTGTTFALVGDFSQCAIGMRMPITIESSQEAGTSFKSAAVLFRAIARVGFVITQPKWLAKVFGITS